MLYNNKNACYYLILPTYIFDCITHLTTSKARLWRVLIFMKLRFSDITTRLLLKYCDHVFCKGSETSRLRSYKIIKEAY